MQIAELHAKMLDLHVRYKEALDAHNLGKAACIRDEAAQLLACEWEQVNEALERAAGPLSAGSEPDERFDAGIPMSSVK